MTATAGLPTQADNGAFSRDVPGLQTHIDSTSLGAFKKCPRYYYLSIVCGWRTAATSVHLEFGILMHRVRELYDHARSMGAAHEEALEHAAIESMKATWDSKLNRPIATLNDSIKNRLTLIRAAVWYFDHYGSNDPLETIQLANGKPAVELSFQFDSNLRFGATSEPIVLCGHFDRIAKMHDNFYIPDIKTTKFQLGPTWYASFSPDNQFSLYTFAGRVVYSVPISGVILDGISLGVNFARFGRHLVPRDKDTLQEWYLGLGYWVAQMELCVMQNEWPQNDKACSMYGGCEFRDICSRSPKSRPMHLQAGFVRRQWDPTIKRGDI